MLLDEIDFDTMALTDGFTVPVEREMLDIEWVSENGEILAVADGNATVDRPKDGDYPLKATASISDLGVTVSRDFHFTVIRHAGNDLLVKKTVLDDSVILDEDGVDTGPKKRLAVDSNANTFWRVDGGDRSLTVDLSAPKMLGEFILVYDGQPVSGFKVEMSREAEFRKPDVYLSGQLQPKAANYLFPEQMSYSRYIRLTCPEGVTGVRFLGGYSSRNESSLEETLWRNISLPEETASDFPLPGETADGVEITWTSSNTAFIMVDGNMARVTRETYKQTVRMKAEITVDEKNYDKTSYVSVTGTGVSGPGGGGGSAYRPGGGAGS
jgi:hypothetical protein